MLWKIDFKKQKNATLNGHTSKNRTNLESRLRFSESFHLILFKTVLFSAHLTHVGTQQRALPPTILGSANNDRAEMQGLSTSLG